MLTLTFEMSTSPGMPAQRACLWRPQSGRAAAHSGHRPAASRRRRPPPPCRCLRPDDRGRRPSGRRVHPDLRAAEACQPHPVEHALREVAMESLSSCRSAPMVTTRIPGVLPSSGFRRARRARRACKQCFMHPHSLNALAAGAGGDYFIWSSCEGEDGRIGWWYGAGGASAGSPEHLGPRGSECEAGRRTV